MRRDQAAAVPVSRSSGAARSEERACVSATAARGPNVEIALTHGTPIMRIDTKRVQPRYKRGRPCRKTRLEQDLCRGLVVAAAPDHLDCTVQVRLAVGELLRQR